MYYNIYIYNNNNMYLICWTVLNWCVRLLCTGLSEKRRAAQSHDVAHVREHPGWNIRNWERRRDLVKLRVLHKCKRMGRCSDADFAQLMQFIMELPVAVS